MLHPVLGKQETTEFAQYACHYEGLYIIVILIDARIQLLTIMQRTTLTELELLTAEPEIYTRNIETGVLDVSIIPGGTVLTKAEERDR